jgi:hypothetical protein
MNGDILPLLFLSSRSLGSTKGGEKGLRREGMEARAVDTSGVDDEDGDLLL